MWRTVKQLIRGWEGSMGDMNHEGIICHILIKLDGFCWITKGNICIDAENMMKSSDEINNCFYVVIHYPNVAVMTWVCICIFSLFLSIGVLYIACLAWIVLHHYVRSPNPSIMFTLFDCGSLANSMFPSFILEM